MRCSPSGEHLARYLHAEQNGLITRKSLTDVIASLDVIALDEIIQPSGERTAQSSDQVKRAQPEPGISPDLIEASVERLLGGRLDNRVPRSAAFCQRYDEAAGACAPEARELEAGQ